MLLRKTFCPRVSGCRTRPLVKLLPLQTAIALFKALGVAGHYHWHRQ